MFCSILDHNLLGLAINSLQFSDGPDLSPYEIMSTQGAQIDWLPVPCCNQIKGSTISLRPSSSTLSHQSLAPCCLSVSGYLVLTENGTGSLRSSS